MHKCPEVDYSTGSLGQGISIGTSIALGAMMKGFSFRTIILPGDGETKEGQVWETLMFAGNRKIKNLIVIFDCNQVQLSSTLKGSFDIEPLSNKLEAFRWQVFEVDGHDVSDLGAVFLKHQQVLWLFHKKIHACG